MLRSALFATLMLGAACIAQAQPDPCVPKLLAEAEQRGGVATTLCGVQLQSHRAGVPNTFSGHITIGLDSSGAIRVLQGNDDSPLALVIRSPATHVGSEPHTIYWGIWNTDDVEFVGRDKVGTAPRAEGSGPYVGGIPARKLPKGVVTYSLLGSPVIVSSLRSANPPVANADNSSKPIEPGPISRADLRVDFGKGIATLKFAFSVRGVAGKRTIEFSRRKFPSLEFESVECENPYFCPRAKLNFYGSDASHAGVLLSVQYDDAMAGPDKIAANLGNVSGTAAIALKR